MRFYPLLKVLTLLSKRLSLPSLILLPSRIILLLLFLLLWSITFPTEISWLIFLLCRVLPFFVVINIRDSLLPLGQGICGGGGGFIDIDGRFQRTHR